MRYGARSGERRIGEAHTVEPDSDDPVELPIDGTLDLHQFRPRDVAALVQDYLDECRARGITSVKIIHGKGIGTLRTLVHQVIARRTDVVAFGLDGETPSGWGATLVTLAPLGDPERPASDTPPSRSS